MCVFGFRESEADLSWWRSYLSGLEHFPADLGLGVQAGFAVALAVECVCVGRAVECVCVGRAGLEADGDAAGLGDGGVGGIVTVRVCGHQTPSPPLTAILSELTPKSRLHLPDTYRYTQIIIIYRFNFFFSEWNGFLHSMHCKPFPHMRKYMLNVFEIPSHNYEMKSRQS